MPKAHDGQSADADAPSEEGPLDFESIYERRFGDVCRWLRALGAPERDLDDLAQDVFTVVHRKLAKFDGEHLSAWLYTIARRTASDYRRRAWFRNVLLRHDDRDEASVPSSDRNPEERLDERRTRERFWRLIGKLDERQRVALVLFEIEGYSGEQIAELQQVPLATVWTRVHHARKKLAALFEETEREKRS